MYVSPQPAHRSQKLVNKPRPPALTKYANGQVETGMLGGQYETAQQAQLRTFLDLSKMHIRASTGSSSPTRLSTPELQAPSLTPARLHSHMPPVTLHRAPATVHGEEKTDAMGLARAYAGVRITPSVELPLHLRPTPEYGSCLY